MKTNIVMAAISAVGLAAALAAPAMAWDGGVNGRPDGFHRGDAAGVYIWHTTGPDHGWHLETTDPRGSGAHEYTGTITTDGRFADVQLVRPESDDSAGIDGSGALNFDLKTYSGIDGVDFRLLGSHELTFSLYEGGQLMSTSSIFIGDNSRHPASDPFTLAW